MPATVVVRPVGTSWMAKAGCRGATDIFFDPPGERREPREVREAEARAICHTCLVMSPCRTWAREHREYGFWGGKSEEERAASGFRADMPVGRIARYPGGEGKPVQARPARSARRPTQRFVTGAKAHDRPRRWTPSSPSSRWPPSGPARSTPTSALGEGLGTNVPPQVTSFSCKPLTISLEEIAAGKIVYERPEVVERLSPKSRQPRSESRRSTAR